MSKFHLYCSCIVCKKEMILQNFDRHFSTHSRPQNYCKWCSSVVSRKKKFCNSSCFAHYNNQHRKDIGWQPSEETRQKLIRSLQEYRLNNPKPKKDSFFGPKKDKQIPNVFNKCKICSKEFYANRIRQSCSDLCKKEIFRRVGCNNAANMPKRSKLEIELFNLCQQEFAQVTHNEQIIDGWDADIIIHDSKIAILWNGPWHYQNMPGLKHSLKQVQNRDRLKIKTLTKAGWRVMIFEDRYYTPLQAFKEIVAEVRI